MAADSNNLIWVDMEMSGLDPTIERVLEVAIVITDTQLNTVAEGPVIVVHQPAAVLDAMDAWNKSTHAFHRRVGARVLVLVEHGGAFASLQFDRHGAQATAATARQIA